MKNLVRSIRLNDHAYRTIFLVMLAAIVAEALAPNLLGRLRVTDLLVSGIMIGVLFVAVRTRRHPVAALVLGLPAIVTRVLGSVLPDGPPLNSTILFLNALFFGFLIWSILSDIMGNRRSTTERIFGALCAYILIGVLFALLYAHLEYRAAGEVAFTFSDSTILDSADSESGLLPLFIYYSFVTLTTLGYGDVTPVSEAARTLAWMEALVGQLYLAVMVAGFVADHISKSGQKGSTGDNPGSDSP